MEGPIFGGAYVRREICVSKSIGLACSGTTSETQGQIVGGEGKSKRKNMARKVKNGEKSPWGQCLTRPVPNGRSRSGC